MSSQVINIKDCAEAMKAMQEMTCIEFSLKETIKFINATISYDGSEWVIASGPNLAFDRSGYGSTIKGAVEDYFSYKQCKKAC